MSPDTLAENLTDADLAGLSGQQMLVLRQRTIERHALTTAELTGADPARGAALLQLQASLMYQIARLKRVMAERGWQPSMGRRWSDVAADLLAELAHFDLDGDDHLRLREVIDEASRMCKMSQRRDRDRERQQLRRIAQ